jgi:hypothetical protein
MAPARHAAMASAADPACPRPGTAARPRKGPRRPHLQQQVAVADGAPHEPREAGGQAAGAAAAAAVARQQQLAAQRRRGDLDEGVPRRRAGAGAAGGGRKPGGRWGEGSAAGRSSGTRGYREAAPRGLEPRPRRGTRASRPCRPVSMCAPPTTPPPAPGRTAQTRCPARAPALMRCTAPPAWPRARRARRRAAPPGRSGGGALAGGLGDSGRQARGARWDGARAGARGWWGPRAPLHNRSTTQRRRYAPLLSPSPPPPTAQTALRRSAQSSSSWGAASFLGARWS